MLYMPLYEVIYTLSHPRGHSIVPLCIGKCRARNFRTVICLQFLRVEIHQELTGSIWMRIDKPNKVEVEGVCGWRCETAASLNQ